MRKQTNERLFLGIDSSTQSLKAIAVDAQLNVVHESAVSFDADLPEFGTSGGAHRGEDGLTVTAPPVMWVAALDLLLERMRAAGFAFGRLAAISGSGQQHGSVYWNRTARRALGSLKPEGTLRDQLAGAFAVDASPIWMDSSTAKQCAEREAALGGAQAVADLTGSRAFERFTVNQIAKIFQENPAGYRASERIGLVSSFVASVFRGDYAPIDVSDGSGMNLMDVRKKQWDRRALDVTAPELEAKLGSLVPSHTVLGPVHAFFTRKYGVAAECVVVAFTGDNPNSLAGLRLEHAGDVAISLGTSDTVFGSLKEAKPSATEGHIFANPVDPDGYMAMICYKNGSLTREDIRDKCSGASWVEFSRVLERTAPGNGGKIGFYIKDPEITPPILKTGVHRFDEGGHRVAAFAPEADVRAVVEGQFLSMRVHGGHIGIQPLRIMATGGASANAAIIKVMADVFGVPVFTGDQPNSAALGAAYRALHGFTCAQEQHFIPFADAVKGKGAFHQAAEPDAAAHRIYTDMLGRYASLERQVTG